jgi:hypothetical protein
MANEAAMPRLEGLCALNALVGIKACLSAARAMATCGDPLVSANLFTGLVVNYARCFEGVQDEELRLSRSFSVRNIVGFDRQIHEALLVARDKHVAHAAQFSNDLEITFSMVTVESKISRTLENGEVETGKIVVNMPFFSQGRSSFGYLKAEDINLSNHFEAIKSAAVERLAQALADHQKVMFERIENGTLKPERADSITHLSGRPSEDKPNLLASFSTADLQYSRATAPEGLGVKFVSLFYSLRKDGANTVLQEDIRIDHRGAE